jgi:hypothetical protein
LTLALLYVALLCLSFDTYPPLPLLPLFLFSTHPSRLLPVHRCHS